MVTTTTGKNPKEPLYLTMTRDEAAAKLSDRIEKANQLTARAVHSQDDFSQIQQAYWTWDEYNQEMLRQMFTNTHMVKEYNPPRVWAISERSLQEETAALRQDIKEKVRLLGSINDRLELIGISLGCKKISGAPNC